MQCLRAGFASCLRLNPATSRTRPQAARLATAAAAERADGVPNARDRPRRQPAAASPPAPQQPPQALAASAPASRPVIVPEVTAEAPHLRGLSQEQLAAVRAALGAVCVVAGPGSGKTAVLVSRVMQYIIQHGARPYQILAITFTRKAADEMRERLNGMLGESCKGVQACTFHSWCYRLLRRHIGELQGVGRTCAFVVRDKAQVTRLLEQLVEAQHPDWSKRAVTDKADELQEAFSRGKSRMDSWHAATPKKAAALFEEALVRQWAEPEDEAGRGQREAVVADLGFWFERYEAALREGDAIDQNDLLGLTVALLRGSRSLRERVQLRYRHLLVDEFQDTNTTQYALVRLLKPPELLAPQDPQPPRHSLFVVGDPDQAIYGWRGADMTNMTHQLPRDYPALQTLCLSVNYRSSARIVATTTCMIQQNRDWQRRQLRPHRGPGPEIHVIKANDVHDEARLVGHEIQRRLNAGERHEEIAVVYRIHKQARLIEQQLIDRKIPYILISGTPFWQRIEIQDLMAYLRLAVGLRDELALDRILKVPKRGIGDTSIKKLMAFARDRATTLPALLFGADAAERAAGGGAPQLPPLPDRKQLGLPKKAMDGLESFRELVAGLHTAARTAPLGDLLQEIVERVEYEAYVQTLDNNSRKKGRKGGTRGGKQEEGEEVGDDAKKRLEHISQLIRAADEFTCEGDPLGLEEEGELDSEQEAAAAAAERVPPAPLDLAREFLSQAALYTAAGDEAGESKGVRLATAHAVKGLEFKVVFVIECTDWPWAAVDNSIESARRLFYVAGTRAKDDLYFTYPRFRLDWDTKAMKPVDRCRFLAAVMAAGHASETTFGPGGSGASAAAPSGSRLRGRQL